MYRQRAENIPASSSTFHYIEEIRVYNCCTLLLRAHKAQRQNNMIIIIETKHEQQKKKGKDLCYYSS